MSKKQTRNIFLVILLLAGVGLALYSLGLINLATITGTNLLSMTKGDLKSSDPFFNSETYELVVTPSANSQYLTGYFSPSEMEKLTGTKSGQGFKLELKLHNYTISYALQNQSEIFGEAKIGTSDFKFTGNSCVDKDSCSDYSHFRSCTSWVASSGRKQTQFFGNPAAKYCAENIKVYGGFVDTSLSGAVHKIDPSPFVDYELEVKITLDNGTSYSSFISPSEQTATIGNAVRIQSTGGGLQGVQYPPSPNSQIVAFIPKGQNRVNIAPYSTYQRLLSLTYSMYGQAFQSNKDTYNSKLRELANMKGSLGQYCKNVDTNYTNSIQTARIKCEPSQTPLLPIVNIYLKVDSTLKKAIPIGKPDILSAGSDQTSAATKSKLWVAINNTGKEKDTFEVTLKGINELTSYSTKAEIAAGITKNVTVDYQGAGTIDKYTIVAKSVNKPSNMDTINVTIRIEPFCTSSAPSAKHAKVMTEYGCTYVCSAYGSSTDTHFSDCGKIDSYDRCTYSLVNGSSTCTSKKSYSGSHCTGIGEYVSTNDYMDAVYKGKLKAFTPQKKTNQYFLVQHDGKMVCNYVDAYGYSDGIALSSLKFNPSLTPSTATKATVNTAKQTQPTAGTTPAKTADTGGKTETQKTIFETISGTSGTQDNTLLYIGIGVVLVIGAVVYMNFGRRR